MRRALSLGVAALALAGCTLDPQYQRPALPTAGAYPSADAAYAADRAHQPANASTVSADLIGWREVFTDPRLQALIALALENNRDLRVAILNISASQAQFRSQRSELFPTIDATTSTTIEGQPATEAVPQVGEPTSSSHYTSHSYSAGLGFTSYELDLFGRIRSLTRAQYQTFLSQVETRRSTQISLVAEVANDYITLLADQKQLQIANQTLDAQGKSYALSKALFDNGTSTLLALREAETTVDTAKASVAQYTRQVAQDENALTLVVGAPIPDTLPPGADLATEGIMADLPAGVPSLLLTQRPDIMAAEHTLLSENAQIGAARAAFFPSISLTGSGGVESVTLNKLFTPAAEMWSFAPQITLPIFSGGQNRANLDYAKVEKRVEIANYEKTIQTAFREVSDALAARGTYLDQLAAEQQLVDAYGDAYRLSTMRFQAGVDTYLSALTTQQSLFESEQTLVSLKASQLQNLVTLYKALGGGWYAVSPTAPSTGG
ncbi:efflux transporter outer membrane subunit [Acidisoma cladoniae]|uniref:efflux transporter outer membrane subunit n=1 Tax=Acidisoma cladoniae TaxID=3040935 RepID=UPI00254F8062|nr:efflux transporter outer membrane subunit [Acidisoma sp. PAMC 29798]